MGMMIINIIEPVWVSPGIMSASKTLRSNVGDNQTGAPRNKLREWSLFTAGGAVQIGWGKILVQVSLQLFGYRHYDYRRRPTSFIFLATTRLVLPEFIFD